MKKDYLCHKIAVDFILNRKNSFMNLSLFENKYVHNLYVNLIKETKNSYTCISNKKSIEEINKTLDKKRLLAKEFKSLTNITWSL